MPPTVDALLPLSFLESVRAADRPADDDAEAEFVAELRNKRLGLSDTVHAQIRRYAEAVRRGHRVPPDEVTALARLIARRPDAEAVFRAAGRLLGARAYATLPAPTRRAMRVLPGVAARPLALRQIRRLVRRHLAGTVRRDGPAVVLEVPAPLPAEVMGACYAATFAELLHRVVGGARAVERVPGEETDVARWRAAWAAAPRPGRTRRAVAPGPGSGVVPEAGVSAVPSNDSATNSG
jgi:hypothetical protein